jgi:hypothetical protein
MNHALADVRRREDIRTGLRRTWAGHEG